MGQRRIREGNPSNQPSRDSTKPSSSSTPRSCASAPMSSVRCTLPSLWNSATVSGRLATGTSILDRHETGPIAPVTAALAAVAHLVGVRPVPIAGARRDQVRQEAAIERRFDRSGPIARTRASASDPSRRARAVRQSSGEKSARPPSATIRARRAKHWVRSPRVNRRRRRRLRTKQDLAFPHAARETRRESAIADGPGSPSALEAGSSHVRVSRIAKNPTGDFEQALYDTRSLHARSLRLRLLRSYHSVRAREYPHRFGMQESRRVKRAAVTSIRPIRLRPTRSATGETCRLANLRERAETPPR